MRKVFFNSLVVFTAVLGTVGHAYACPDIDGVVDVDCDGVLRIATFGDSITKGEGDRQRLGYPGRLKNYFPNAHIRNLGLSGESTPRGRTRARSVFSNLQTTDYIVILEGTNDFFLQIISAFSTRNNLLAIRDSADRTGALPLLAKLTRTRRGDQEVWVEAVNRAISPYTDLDFFSLGKNIIGPDRLHPNGAGYERMARQAAMEIHDESEDHRPRDTDGDTVYDYEEHELGTNRNNPDSDGDGISDGAEVYTYHSNPLSLDSDGDGLSDNYEVHVLGSDPASARPGAPTIITLDPLSNP